MQDWRVKMCISARRRAVPQTNHCNDKTERIKFRFYSSSTRFFGLGPVRFLSFLRFEKVGRKEKQLILQISDIEYVCIQVTNLRCTI